MSEFTFAIPYTMDLIHAARLDDDGEMTTTACGHTEPAAGNYIRLDLYETTCRACLTAMGWQTGVIKDFFGPGQDLPATGPKEMFEKYGGKRA